MQKIMLSAAFVLLLFSMTVSPSWAVPVNTNIEILNGGSGSGFRYSVIHSANCSSTPLCMSGSYLYGTPLTGSLNGDFDITGPLSLRNIRGTLNAPQGNIQFTGGFLNTSGEGGLTSGELQYSFLSGNLQGETGTFYFLASQHCCAGGPFGGPNHLTASGFTLWGNNWDIMANSGLSSRQAVLDAGFTPLGIDIVGVNYTATPEPSSMLLLGSGLAGLFYWRKKQVHQVE
ncbi:MAG: hypothetical protein NPIRA01_20520 [Nitrospirales bacterium]|nr:MAG: hypothetical protein NPIRA01_20520 [Nitrospirales bacterium]